MARHGTQNRHEFRPAPTGLLILRKIDHPDGRTPDDDELVRPTKKAAMPELDARSVPSEGASGLGRNVVHDHPPDAALDEQPGVADGADDHAGDGRLIQYDLARRDRHDA